MANEIPCAPKLKNKLEIHEARKTNQDSGSIFSAISMSNAIMFNKLIINVYYDFRVNYTP